IWNAPAGSVNVNSGTVNVTGGDLTLNLPSSPTQTWLTNSGTIHVSSGRTFAIYGQLTNYNKTTQTLTGGVYDIAGTFTFGNLWSPPPAPGFAYTPVDIQTLTADVTLSAAGALIRDTYTRANCFTARTIIATSHLTVLNGASALLGVGGNNYGELTIGV